MASPQWPENEGVYLFVELYNLNVWLFTDEKPYKKAMKCIDGESAEDSKACGLTTYSVHKDGTNIFAVGVFDEDPATLVHELAHVTIFACEHLGFEPQDGSGEPFAYLQEFLYTNLLPHIIGDLDALLETEEKPKEKEETEEK